MSQTQQPLDSELRDSEVHIQNKNVAAVWILLLTQLFYCFMYDFFIQINTTIATSSESFIHTAFLFILIVAGKISLMKVLEWPFLRHFNLYGVTLDSMFSQPLFRFKHSIFINAFWKKAGIYGNGAFIIYTYQVYLVPNALGSYFFHANLNEALKCALDCIVSSILAPKLWIFKTQINYQRRVAPLVA